MISGLHPRIWNSDGTPTATIDIQRIKSSCVRIKSYNCYCYSKSFMMWLYDVICIASVHIIMILIIVFLVLLQRQKHSEFPMFFVNSGGLQIAMTAANCWISPDPQRWFHPNPDFTSNPRLPRPAKSIKWSARFCLGTSRGAQHLVIMVIEHVVRDSSSISLYI